MTHRSRRPDWVFNLMNLQCLCRACNKWKGSRVMDFRRIDFVNFVQAQVNELDQQGRLP